MHQNWDKNQPEHVLKLFLNFEKISASCSYKLGSYKKKRCSSIHRVSEKNKRYRFEMALLWTKKRGPISPIVNEKCRTKSERLTDGWSRDQKEAAAGGGV